MENTSTGVRLVANLYRAGKYDKAHETVSRYLEVVAPNDGKAWELCGIIRSAQKDTQGAIDALEMAGLLVAVSPAGQCVLAQCYAAVGHKQLASEMLQFLLTKPCVPPSLYPSIAAAFGGLGEPQLALQACRQAAKHEVDGAEPLFGMAHYMRKLDYPLDMIASVLGKAVDLDPNRFCYRLALAKTLGQIGRYQDAYDALKSVTAERIQALNCAACLRRLEEIYRRADDHPMAEGCRQRASEIEAKGDGTGGCSAGDSC